MIMEQYKAKIEKLVFGGQALAHLNGRTVFLWNALPDEEVEFIITRKHKGILEGIATKIISPSPYRIEPQENHYLSCSPWQIIDFKEENYWKIQIAREVYKKVAPKEILDSLDIEFDEENKYNYRNKIEFSFTRDKGQLALAFFEREARKHVAVDGCILAPPEINLVAQKILKWLNSERISPENLKTLIIKSNRQNKIIAALFIKTTLSFENYPELDENFIGFEIYYSEPQSPVALPTMLVYSSGQNSLGDEIVGVGLEYGIFSFFQINTPLFIRALKDIKGFIDKGNDVVDFYSGVGAISLPLANGVGKLILIDSGEESVNYARKNIELNRITNARAIAAPAEKMLDEITKDKTIIFDPPRVGLHPKMINRVLEKKPKRIIYLSCNLSTQARDLLALLAVYEIKFAKLYNFFPRTPHIESLIILDHRQ